MPESCPTFDVSKEIDPATIVTLSEQEYRRAWALLGDILAALQKHDARVIAEHKTELKPGDELHTKPIFRTGK